MKSLAFLVLLIMMLAVPFATLQAHGLGRQQLERAEAGPFLVSAWTEPDPARVDQALHVTIGVEYENDLLLNADVTVTAILIDDPDKRETAHAVHENAANKLHYEAPLRLAQAGSWQVTITIADEQGEGQVSFELDVEAGGQNPPWTWIGAGIIGISLFGLVAFNRLRLNQGQKKVQPKS